MDEQKYLEQVSMRMNRLIGVCACALAVVGILVFGGIAMGNIVLQHHVTELATTACDKSLS